MRYDDGKMGSMSRTFYDGSLKPGWTEEKAFKLEK